MIGFIHEGEPFIGEIEQPPLYLAGMNRNARVSIGQANELPSITHVSRWIMFFDTDQLYARTLLVACRKITTGRSCHAGR